MGIAAALPMLAFALFSPFAPKAARRFGMERVLAASLALMIVGLVCRSSGPSESLLAGGTLLLAAAIAMGNVLLPALAKRNLPGRVGLAVGTLSVVMALSSALAASASVPLAEYAGWQWSLAVWLLPATAALCVWLAIARRAGAERTGLKICFQTASQAIYGGCVRLGASARLWVFSPFCFIRWSISCLRC